MCGFENLRKVAACVMENELIVQVLSRKDLLMYEMCLRKSLESQFFKGMWNYRSWENKNLAYCMRKSATEKLATSIIATFETTRHECLFRVLIGCSADAGTGGICG